MLSSHLGHSRSQPDPPLESSERMHRQPSPLLRVASSSARATHTRSSPFVSWRHLHAAAFHEERAMRRGEWRSCHVLFQQIYRDGEEDDVLHEERDVTRHGREPPGRRRPAVRHEGNDGDGSEECRAGAQSSENPESLVPESQEQEQCERPLRQAQEPARSLDAEYGVHPRNQWAVADKWNQHFRLVREPLLVPEEQEENDHRAANEVIVEVLFEETELEQGLDERVHGLGTSFVSLRRDTATSGYEGRKLPDDLHASSGHSSDAPGPRVNLQPAAARDTTCCVIRRRVG